MNTPETVCLGMNDGIRCTKLISNDAVFCLDCDSGNNDSLPGTHFRQIYFAYIQI